ncbi:MAG: hypothetical protein HUU20_03650 [Pirellulales bacterium]|nr:hypothetical protein [Pirellulales bacterium]
MIAIKPHHFVDILTALGEGHVEFQPHAYGHALHCVAEAILRDGNALLRMELGADDICQPCCHNLDGSCNDTIDTSFRPEAPKSKREWNLLIDRRWCERLGLAQDDCLTAREFCLRLRESSEDISDIYREMPRAGVLERQAKLQKGISLFLAKTAPVP